MSTITVTNIKATGETASRAATGVAAAYINFNGSGTIAIRDSFNVASITDNSTGNYTVTLSNAMSTATDWSGSISGNGAGYTHSFGGTSGAFTATTFPVNSRAQATNDTDINLICGQAFGDLA